MTDKELTDLKIEFASFTATVTEWMKTTKEYREHLCKKIDNLKDKNEKVVEKFSKLPCPKREWIPKAIYVLYGIDIILISALVKAFVDRIAK